MVNIINLTKKFGNHTVLKNLNLTVESGEITALVGKNGAGKSTLIRSISGLLKPDSGKIEIEDNSQIGILMGSEVNLYRNLTSYEIIHYFGSLHGMKKQAIDKRINELDEVLNFKDFINKRACTFSRGMSQKIGFMISLIHNPDILLLDEPSTGLDLEASNDVINFIKYLKTQNKAILIATHNIFEISDLSDNIAFLNEGTIQGKINTHLFFESCPSNKKSDYIINTLEKKKGPVK